MKSKRRGQAVEFVHRRPKFLQKYFDENPEAAQDEKSELEKKFHSSNHGLISAEDFLEELHGADIVNCDPEDIEKLKQLGEHLKESEQKAKNFQVRNVSEIEAEGGRVRFISQGTKPGSIRQKGSRSPKQEGRDHHRDGRRGPGYERGCRSVEHRELEQSWKHRYDEGNYKERGTDKDDVESGRYRRDSKILHDINRCHKRKFGQLERKFDELDEYGRNKDLKQKQREKQQNDKQLSFDFNNEE